MSATATAEKPVVRKVRKRAKPESSIPTVLDYLTTMKWPYKGPLYKDSEVPALPCGLKVVGEIRVGGHDVYLLQNKGLDVWSFGGTFPLDVKDWATNFKIRLETFDYPDWAGTRAHRGAKDIIQVLKERVNRKKISPYSGRKLVLTGHSQGFMKACAAVPWSLQREYGVSLVVGAGCPRVGDKPFIEALSQKVPVLAITHGADPARFLPPRTFGGYEAFPAIHLADGGAQVRDPDGALWEWFTKLCRRKLSLHEKGLLTQAAVADHDLDLYIEAWKKMEDSDDELPKRIIRQHVAKIAARCGIDPVALGVLRLQ